MNRRLLTILVLAFVIAGACAFLVYRVVGKSMAAEKPAASTRVIAAVSDIKLGTVLAAKDLTTIEIVGTLPKGVILKPENAVGRGVVADLYMGEPIMESRLAAVGSGGGLAATIPQGMRAVAVRVDDVVGVAGFATPGMRVDVLISGEPPSTPGNQAQIQAMGTLSETLLQNIEVLSAGQDIQKDAEGKPHPVQVVNLLVTPDQAETMSLAGSQTKIQLVLRNPLDTKVAPVAGTAMDKLFADQTPAPVKTKTVVVKAKPAPKVVAAPPPFSIEVINGSKRSEAKFGSPGGQQ
jgi:pilus assembly protein CpaB